ncbi:MAG: transcription elongation factor GreA [Candidatus Portnoybacteria bacterium]|nr:transcription elongation factor GreA [Candidatus Portnoybacteria bacterium]
MQYISREGLEELKAEIKQHLKTRQEIAKSLEEAKGQGDLSENAEYAEAKENQAFNEGRIMELEQMIKNAVVISKTRKDDKVSVGAVVKAKSGNETFHFHIVGSEEADPAKGKISNESPLGKALLGRKAGEIVEAETPRGKVKYKIVGIE